MLCHVALALPHHKLQFGACARLECVVICLFFRVKGVGGILPFTGERVASVLGDKYNTNGKSGITVENLLLHNAGFPPDPHPEFWSPQFACPATMKNLLHPAEDFSCQNQM